MHDWPTRRANFAQGLHASLHAGVEPFEQRRRSVTVRVPGVERQISLAPQASQSMSTVTSPRARMPLTLPWLQAFGSAGRMCDLAVLALQQHLDHARRGAEVAVDLERRMRVPEIRQRAVAQQPLQQLVRAVAVAQARPEVDLPGAAPAGAGITARIERGARRGGELGVLHRIDGMPGMQREQVRHVAMVVLRVVEVRLPFLQLAPLADAQAADRASPAPSSTRLRECLVARRARAASTRVGEQVRDDLLRHRRAGGERPVFGRVAGTHDAACRRADRSTSASSQNSAAPFITGQARCFRNFASRLNR